MNSIIQQTADYVRSQCEHDSSGHDWWHIYRVWKNARAICEREKANSFIVELAALLHDLDDWKLSEQGSGEPLRARAWLEACDVDQVDVDIVCEIITHVSFKGAGVANTMESLEGLIVQDADRLDAIGAVGIGRAFAYGGHKHRHMHNPKIEPSSHTSFEEYKNSNSTTVNHFYEKLLLLKDRMNTTAARRIAEGRHIAMVQFLERFLREWDGGDV
ncbi:MAG: HD domain-containing protein [Spirochaetaceae bacterium]|nr:MAG: HD domain-containing protein [Spirochaetaceae bacterium]